MNNKNKYIWAGVGVVVVLLAVWLVMKNQGTSPSVYENKNAQNQAQVNDTRNAQSQAAAKNTNLAYNAALAKYGTNRIQFQQSCQTVPNNVVYKSGTAVMLDNRASITHTITIDSMTYVIPAYDYKVATLSSTKLPHTILVDCDKSQNVATILLEK